MFSSNEQFEEPVIYEALFDSETVEDFELTDAMSNPIAFKATMYLDKALKAPDQAQFVKAMAKEITDHCERKHWEIMARSQVPKDHKVLPAVWAMRCK